MRHQRHSEAPRIGLDPVLRHVHEALVQVLDALARQALFSQVVHVALVAEPADLRPGLRQRWDGVHVEVYALHEVRERHHHVRRLVHHLAVLVRVRRVAVVKDIGEGFRAGWTRGEPRQILQENLAWKERDFKN